MLPPVPDWRWGMAGDATGWYPAMRLFRRRHGQAWPSLITEVAAALDRWLIPSQR